MRHEIKIWWEQSKYDFETAEILFKEKRYSSCAFYCQQSIEKGLKAAFILIKNEASGQTHSLIYLGKEINIPKQYFSILQDLTPEFVNTRYPDISNEIPHELYNKEKVESYLTRTKEVLQWLEQLINKQKN